MAQAKSAGARKATGAGPRVREGALAGFAPDSVPLDEHLPAEAAPLYNTRILEMAHGGLNGLARLSFADLVKEPGIGEAKAAELKAVFRLAGLIRDLPPESRPVVRTPVDVMDLVGHELAVRVATRRPI